jgi:hypothetical protein
MLTFISLVVLSQVVTTPVTPPAAPEWGAPITYTAAGQQRQVYVNPVLVAEPKPSAEGAAAVRALDASAVVVVDRPTMRVWRVASSAAVLARRPSWLPVLHDLPSGAGRLQVPVGVVCAGERVALPGLPALARVTADQRCLPDFWMKSATK